MPKNDNAHSIRMVESLKKHVGADYATDFESRYPMAKSADIKKKFEWAKATCNYLEEHFDSDTLLQLRKDCRCNDGKAIADKLLRCLNKANNIQEFVEMFNKNETFANLEYVSNNKILFCYPECYCACVKRVNQGLSKIWCYCTLGNAEGIFSKFLNKEVHVDLLESIKTGGSKCVIEVEW